MSPALKTQGESEKSQPIRIALVGVGNELYGDDAAGVKIVRTLRHRLPQISSVIILDAGPSPESFTGVIRRFAPGLVVIIDAADMGEPPGTIQWIEWQQVTGLSAATHRLPPTVLAKFLMKDVSSRVVLLGIQAATVEFDQPISKPVKNAIRNIINSLFQILFENGYL
jgi:hydrogenase 3 maturation protease